MKEITVKSITSLTNALCASSERFGIECESTDGEPIQLWLERKPAREVGLTLGELVTEVRRGDDIYPLRAGFDGLVHLEPTHDVMLKLGTFKEGEFTFVLRESPAREMAEAINHAYHVTHHYCPRCGKTLRPK